MILLLLALAAGPPTVGQFPFLTGDRWILDPQKRFPAELVAPMEQELRRLYQKYGYEMRIETVERLPSPEGLSGFWYWHRRQEQLRSWVLDRARASGMNQGIYVVITQTPLDVRVEAWPADSNDKFYTSRRDEIRRGMLQALKVAAPERALKQGIERFEYLLQRTQEIPSPFRLLPYLLLIALLAGLWLGLLLLRRQLIGTTPLYPPAVQGGILGTPAASWIYDRLFQLGQERTRT
jgi:hypothetical protein